MTYFCFFFTQKTADDMRSSDWSSDVCSSDLITLVYQHYAPLNLASFIQRKGRGGRGSDDRPITAATLSIYSSRDSWWFRKPHEMIEPSGFDTPLNPNNHFVRRGQVLATMLDAFARHQRRRNAGFDLATPPRDAIEEAETLVSRIFGPEPWREFSQDSLLSLWQRAHRVARGDARLHYLDRKSTRMNTSH